MSASERNLSQHYLSSVIIPQSDIKITEVKVKKKHICLPPPPPPLIISQNISIVSFVRASKQCLHVCLISGDPVNESSAPVSIFSPATIRENLLADELSVH